MFQNIAQYFVNIWNAVVAFFVNAGPMVWLSVVAVAIVGAMVGLYVSNLERTKAMLDSEEIGELAQTMWEEYQRGHALEVDTSIVGVDCPACGMFLEEGHVCVNEDEDYGTILLRAMAEDAEEVKREA
jgi:hypothetical protein